MSYADDSAAGKHSQEANHYHPTPWLRKWALVETGTFIQSPLRGDMALRLAAEWPTAAASCNHVPVTMDDLSGGVLHSWMVGEKRGRLCFIQITCGPHCQHALMSFKNTYEISSLPLRGRHPRFDRFLTLYMAIHWISISLSSADMSICASSLTHC